MEFSKVIAFFVHFEFHEIIFGGKMQHTGILYLTQIHKTKILKEIIVFCAKKCWFSTNSENKCFQNTQESIPTGREFYADSVNVGYMV